MGNNLTVNGTAGSGSFNNVSLLVIVGQGGGDSLSVDNLVTVSSYILGGAGNDFIQGGGGGDALYGQEGNNTVRGGLGNDRVDGGAGTDFLAGDAGTDVIYASGDRANDLILSDGSDVILKDKKDKVI